MSKYKGHNVHFADRFEQPIACIPSSEAFVMILGFFDYLDTISNLLQVLSKKSRAFRKKERDGELFNTIPRWPSLKLHKAIDANYPGKTLDFQFPTRD